MIQMEILDRRCKPHPHHTYVTTIIVGFSMQIIFWRAI